MSTVPDPDRVSHPHHSTGLPDELSAELAALFAEVDSLEEPLTESELDELYQRDCERRMSDEILAAVAANLRLSEVLADLGFPARVAI